MMYKRLIWVPLFLLSIAYNFPVIKWPLNVYDEGLILVGADRVLKGHLPYIDFWSIYPPGQFYTIAFLFKLFGSSMLVERIYDITIKSFLSISIFLITRKLDFSNKVAFICWGMSLIWIHFSRSPAYPVYAAILVIFIGVYFFLHYLETSQPHWLLFGALFITLGVMFRHDIAGMAAIAFLIAILIKNSIGGESLWNPVLYFTCGVLLSGLPFFIYIINAIGLQPIVNQLILTPMEIIPKYRGLPYPSSVSLNTMQFFIFPIVSLVGFFVSLVLIIKRKVYSKLSYGMFLLSLMGILFINQVRVRSDDIHLLPVAIVGITITPSLFYIITSSSFNILTPKASKILVFIFIVVIGATFYKPVCFKVRSLNSNYFAIPNRSAIAAEGYSGMVNDWHDLELHDLVLYVQSITTENDSIYVGAKNHDRFIINDVIIYFLANRKYATKYHELCPGVTSTSGVQKEIIEEINKSSAKIIVLIDRYWFEPNDSSIDSKIDLLDDYIATNYDMVKKFGTHEVWLKRVIGPNAKTLHQTTFSPVSM